ncbi:MAG: manganese efflux pump MntP family protein [Candidatus Hydrogenedentes bacterium]|nr:manganese efflux pump MntP family protein [Candidatus Hydrogenedentota bacterium]
MLEPLVLAGIAIALSMDAFAVSMGISAYLKRISPRQSFRLSFHFGLFQAIMPILGWATGNQLGKWFSDYDHWLAFFILVGLGIKMIYQSVSERDVQQEKKQEVVEKYDGRDPTRGLSLIVLSIATSIDAYAVGLTFSIIGVSVWFPAFWIGLTTSFFTLLGMRIGSFMGYKFGKWIEVLGALILILIGCRILLQHVLS